MEENILDRLCKKDFVGKKTGYLIAVFKHGENDYSVWWRDVSEMNDETAGCSVRGTAYEVLAELEGEY